jgi:dipeptidyl aminopeptidase/acylaminoacyl peptidase
MGKEPGLTDGDLFQVRWLGDPRLSPDGGHLAYVVAGLDAPADIVAAEIVVIDLVTGDEHHIAPGGHRSTTPRWSPLGDRLAFLSDANGTPNVWLWEPDGRTTRQVSFGPGPVVDLDWSPDGAALVITAAVSSAGIDVVNAKAGTFVDRLPFRVDGQPGLSSQSLRVRVIGADGSDRGEVSTAGDDDWHARWSPDGAHIAFLSRRSGSGEKAGIPRLWVITGAQQPHRVRSAPGPVMSFTWSPWGDALAYLGPRHDAGADIDCRLYRCNLGDRSAGAELAPGWDRSLGSTVRGDDVRGTGPPPLLWSSATKRLYLTVADGGTGALGWVDATGEDYGYLTGGERACLDPALAFDGKVIAFVSTCPTDPGNVSLIDLGTGTEKQVTRANQWLASRQLATARPITAETPNGTPLEGWVTAQDHSSVTPRPLVTNVHGGPHYSVGWRFSFEAQRLAARGYAVLTGNPRGSGGYGRAFATAIRGRWGSVDVEDVYSLIDAGCQLPGVDRERLAITGVSYGGYLVLSAITQGPRFRAAICENGISNLVALWGVDDDAGVWLSGELGGSPWERPELYLAASPITRADRVEAPLLLIHADLDHGCPIAQSEQLYAALRYLGREVTFLRLHGEGHLVNLVGRPSRRLARAEAVNNWLSQHLDASNEGETAGA